ncbi:1-phosphofructokinase family hexose kinase [Streptomyces lichenis]|uniref:1-phosphofructokinase family hexose kinase n=1 Tax=Streptomyces lichenis TaxID=2306967 RepID=A0ABT0IH70_9ACTN|nr:1-phosphofructokinase family hexose kinase [Streptomyces lichenis]MCK8680661.1 1-phosphofructokinase family hexose kinase [Streptomyces lichenis]
MIITVTPNPALDITHRLDTLRPHTSHRVAEVHEQAGGKGVNTARVLTALGRPATAVLPLGGPTGDLLRADLARSGIRHRAVPLAHGSTRRTLTLVHDGDATVLNEPGPRLDPADFGALRAAVAELLPGARALTLAGSLPPGLPGHAYRSLTELAAAHRVPVVLDTSGKALLAALPAGPAVVKPNAAELAETTGLDDPLAAARTLAGDTGTAVVASLGADGLLAVTPQGSWRARLSRPLPAAGPAGRNPTGAGDSAVAALAAGLADGTPWPELLADAVALSAATVLTRHAGAFDPQAHRELRPAVVVTRLPEPSRPRTAPCP